MFIQYLSGRNNKLLPLLTCFDPLSESEIVYHCIELLIGSVLSSKSCLAEWALVKHLCCRDKEFIMASARDCRSPELIGLKYHILVATIISLHIKICIIIKFFII